MIRISKRCLPFSFDFDFSLPSAKNQLLKIFITSEIQTSVNLQSGIRVNRRLNNWALASKIHTHFQTYPLEPHIPTCIAFLYRITSPRALGHTSRQTCPVTRHARHVRDTIVFHFHRLSTQRRCKGKEF